MFVQNVQSPNEMLIMSNASHLYIEVTWTEIKTET